VPAIDEGLRIAASERPGPVLVDITKDAQQASVEWKEPQDPVGRPSEARRKPRPDRGALEQALTLIRSAKRPVILAGRGVLLSGSYDQLREFAERTNTPIAVTLLGIGGL